MSSALNEKLFSGWECGKSVPDFAALNPGYDHPGSLPFNSHPNFSRAFFAISGLGVLDGGNSSFQWNGLQALISATEWVMLPALRRSGGIAGSALESHEPLMNWIGSAGSVRVIIAHSMWSRLVTSTSSSHTTMYFDA